MQDSTTKKDYSIAFHWMKKAADMNDPEAMFQLGVMYCSGYSVKKDTEQGERWFDMAITWHRNLTGRIAILFHASEDMQNFTLAYKWYKRLEAWPLAKSKPFQLGLGLLYEYGDGVEQDYQKALEYYTSLVDESQYVGKLRLGLMYYYGKGVAVDYRESLDLFQRSSGYFYDDKDLLPYVYNPNNLNGRDSQDDLVYSLVDKYDVLGEAEYYLGLQYKYGQGVPDDQDKAQHHFRKAYGNGCNRAECELDDRH
jgi:TPR repeat protein